MQKKNYFRFYKTNSKRKTPAVHTHAHTHTTFTRMKNNCEVRLFYVLRRRVAPTVGLRGHIKRYGANAGRSVRSFRFRKSRDGRGARKTDVRAETVRRETGRARRERTENNFEIGLAIRTGPDSSVRRRQKCVYARREIRDRTRDTDRHTVD